MLTKKEKSLILKLISSKICKDEFYKRFPTQISENNSYIKDSIENASRKKDGDDLTYIFYLRGYQSAIEPLDTHFELLRELALADWHKEHEYIIDALDIEGSEEELYQMANSRYDYLDENDNESLAKRCVYALSSIGSDLSLEKLRQLTKHHNHKVRKLAKGEVDLHL